MFPDTPQFDAALEVLRTLRAAGHEAYLAGGCVRDLLLGREPKDYDVATAATPDVVLRLFPRTFAVGAHFGVVLVATRGTRGAADGTCGAAESHEVVTEVATFRSDGAYSDGRHPDAVRYTASAEEDVRRRDFTINGLLLNPIGQDLCSSRSQNGDLRHSAEDRIALKGHGFSRAAEQQSEGAALAAEGMPIAEDPFPQGLKPGSLGPQPAARLKPCPFKTSDAHQAPEGYDLRSTVIDHVNGLADLDAGIVRAIGRPELRFEEDHLRMVRGVRFAARFGFELEPQTAAAMRRLAARTAAVSRERVRDELTKMLTEGHARRAFELLDETGLLVEVLPEVARMKGVAQPPQFHPEGDVWTHTLMLLEQLEAGCPLILAWGALLHDVGKPPTFRLAERIRFDGHVEVGVAMGAEICRRFRFSNDETRQTLALIENHMRFMDAPRMKASTLKRFFRLEGFDQHLALHRMDCLAASGNLENWEFVRERYLAMPEEAVRPRPLLTGRELIAAGYVPGASFKQMLHAVEDAQLEGTIATADEALKLVRERFPTM
jgi:putative nucleotidyltransferase with HDIG domain